MSFKLDTSKIISGLNNTVMKSQLALNLYADTASKKLEAKAKTDAPWIDRTGHARQRITGSYKPVGATRTRIELSHGVDYGFYLEFCHDEQNAVLGPTLDSVTPSIIKGMNNLIK